MWISFDFFLDVRRVAPHEGLREPKVKIGFSGDRGGLRGYRDFRGGV
jgi:hypothetical protein